MAENKISEEMVEVSIRGLNQYHPLLIIADNDGKLAILNMVDLPLTEQRNLLRQALEQVEQSILNENSKTDEDNSHTGRG